MSHPDCPRQVSFTLPGLPGVKITAVEVAGGKIQFTADVQDSSLSDGDLRALFFHIEEAKLAGMTVTSSEPMLTESRVGLNNVLDLGDGATLAGAVKTGFDIGTEWGTPGGKFDDVNFAVTFTISNSAGNLTLDDIGGQLFGAKLDSVGGRGGPGGSSAKLTGLAPWAPDALDDVFSMYEDGAAGLGSPSKTATFAVIDVLGNDLDHDTSHGLLTIDHIVDGAGPSHGTIAIVDNKIQYTPDLDYSGTDSFWYCMTDGNGGQDSAQCTITITAVADDPIITFSLGQGTTINDTLVTVTATQNDADGSEIISSLDWSASGLPAGATITPAGPISGSGDHITQQFIVSTAPGIDWNFNADFTATSSEASNGDTETNTGTQSFVGNSEHLGSTLTYTVTDQSIWDTGNAFHYDLGGPDGFFGIDEGDSGGDSFDVLGVTVAGYHYEYQLTAGFQLEVHLDGGGIDASIPVDVTVDSTYNHTTDTIYIDSAMGLGSGGSFHTTGPEGNLSLDFLFNYLFAFSAFSDIFPDINIGPFSNNFDTNIIDLDTSDPAYHWPILPGIVDLVAEWPHISVDNDPGTMTGTDFSNYMLALELDVDGAANALLGGALSFLDSDPTTEDNFEILDFDLVGGLRLLQEFAVGLGAGQTVNLVLEDNTVVPMTIGTGLWINNASSHDVDHDGIVNFSFALDPDVQLSNSTSIDVALSAQFALIRNLDLGVTEVTVFNDDDIPIADVPIEIYNNTFALNGVGSQEVTFFV